MTWTYVGDPAASPTAALHFLVGDTDPQDQLLSDEEIAWQYGQETHVAAGQQPTLGSLYRVAASLADKLAAQFARKADYVLGDAQLKASQKAIAFRQAAAELRRKANSTGLVPFAGGMSQAAKLARAQNPDAVQPFFTRDMQNVPSGQSPTVQELDEFRWP